MALNVGTRLGHRPHRRGGTGVRGACPDQCSAALGGTGNRRKAGPSAGAIFAGTVFRRPGIWNRRNLSGFQTLRAIGPHGVDDLRLWASEPSGRAGTGHAHHHRVEHSEATWRDACRLDGLTPVPVDPPILDWNPKVGSHPRTTSSVCEREGASSSSTGCIQALPVEPPAAPR